MNLWDLVAQLLCINQIKPTDLVFVVIGPSGVGKSSFINKAAGKDILKVGHDLETVKTAIRHVLCPIRNDQRIVLVDTPEFPLDPTSKKRIRKWMQKRLKNNLTFHGVLYLHRITDNRLYENPTTHWQTYESLAGSQYHSCVALVTTGWNMLRSPTIGDRREEQLKEEWQKIMGEGSIVLRYDNSEEAATKIIDQMSLMSTQGTSSAD